MRKLSLLALVLGLVACRDSGGGDDGPSPDASTTGGEVTIQEVQNDSMVAGTKVTLKGVIVTAIDNFGSRKGDIWVQEPGGGEYSGVQVYGAPLDQVAALVVGDVIDITGAQKAEFALSSDTSGNTLTELEPVDGGTMVVTKVSSGTPPAPAVVDALAIGQLTDFMARHAEWEKWEGVPVTLNNIAATSAQECITSMGDCTDTTYNRFDATGDIQVQSGLAAMPEPKVARGDCFASITGIVTYFFDYQINPRTEAEYATGGTACPTENQSATCGDSMDNDGDGFTDCNDISCVVGAATCRMDEDADIETEIQSGTHKDKYVMIQDAIVTALSFSKNDIWIATNLAAGENEGLQVHFNEDVPDTVVVGKTVTVIGKIIEFNDSANTGTGTLTEMSGYDIQVSSTATVLPTAITGVQASTLNDDTTGEPYESVLVTLTNVEITTAADSNHVGSMTQGSEVFKFDDTIHRLSQEGTTGTCYSTITGIWTYNVYDNHWVFFPRAAGTTGAGC